MLQRVCSIASLWLVLSLAGCREAEDPNLPPLVSAKGTVRLDGKPYSGATVVFLPAGENMASPASGFTDAEGKYTLQTLHRGEGAAAGDYRVTISRFVMPDGSPYQPGPDSPAPIDVGAVEELAPGYSDPAASRLTAKVGATENTIDFDLKRKP
jgi:hypothetical protein